MDWEADHEKKIVLLVYVGYIAQHKYSIYLVTINNDTLNVEILPNIYKNVILAHLHVRIFPDFVLYYSRVYITKEALFFTSPKTAHTIYFPFKYSSIYGYQ